MIKKLKIKIDHCFKIVVKDSLMGLNNNEARELLNKHRTNRGYGNESWDVFVKGHFNGLLLASPQTSGFDLVHKKYGKIEVKTFTAATQNKSHIGGNFKPSCLKGTGRGHNLTNVEKGIKSNRHIKRSNYHCFVDITEYPVIFIRFIKSLRLLSIYPNYLIPQKDRFDFMMINDGKTHK